MNGMLYANRKGKPTILKNAKPKEKACSYIRKGPLLALSWSESRKKNLCLLLTTIALGYCQQAVTFWIHVNPC